MIRWMATPLTDTDREADSVHLNLLREAGPTRRAEMALSLSAQVIALARQGIQRAFPEMSDLEVRLRFVELYYGCALAADLRRFLDQRNA
jgi:hypothetical protein